MTVTVMIGGVGAADELDRRDVLEAKDASLPHAENVTAVEADLARELPLPPFEGPVLWVAEGLFFYVAEPSIVDLCCPAPITSSAPLPPRAAERLVTRPAS